MRRSVLLLAALTVAVLLASGVALAVTPEGAGHGSLQGTGGRDATLDHALEELVAMHGGPPGVIAIVQRGPHREVHSFGVRNLKGALRMRANDHMRLASTSKAFSGAVSLSLVSKGVLSLNDTIGECLPGLPKSWHKITLRQLLNHTSGLPNFTEDQDFLAALGDSPKNAPWPRQLLSYAEDEPLILWRMSR